MRTVFGVLGILALAATIPACKDSGNRGPSAIEVINQSFPPLDPGSVTVSVQNNDAVYYYLSLLELTGGIPTSQVDMFWPVMAAENGIPSIGREKSWIFQSDSADITHAVVIFDQDGLVLDRKPFVKGSVPAVLFVTITSGIMSVQVSP